MSPSAELHGRARGFAERLNDLLNRTVTNGPRLSTVMSRDGALAWIGFDIAKNDLVPTEAIPLKIGDGPARSYLHLYHVLKLEPGTNYLVTSQSNVGLHFQAGLDDGAQLLRYDYDREKEGGFSEAHLHVYGDMPGLDRMCRTGERRLKELHLPVSGRRFRPAVEDVIEFAIIEGLADGRDGWESAVEEHRQFFHDLQLRAAVRRKPDVARQALESLVV